MSTKQLYEKTSEGMKEVSPLVAIEDIYSKLSDTPLEALVSLYNHVKCEWKGSVADTRRTVPSFLRRSGLFITYNNGTKYITEFFSAGTDQITTEGWVKDSNWTPVPYEDYISAGVKPGVGSIGYEQLNDNLKQLFREKVNVINFPDDEDITSVDNMLKLKDREANVSNFQSKGYIILRKNLCLVNGVVKNILTQNMINKPNTVYEIRYDFDLNGTTINLSQGCILKFCGGSLNNGQLYGQNNTLIDFKNNLNVELLGEFKDNNEHHISLYYKVAQKTKTKYINNLCYISKYNTFLDDTMKFNNTLGIDYYNIVYNIDVDDATNATKILWTSKSQFEHYTTVEEAVAILKTEIDNCKHGILYAIKIHFEHNNIKTYIDKNLKGFLQLYKKYLVNFFNNLGEEYLSKIKCFIPFNEVDFLFTQAAVEKNNCAIDVINLMSTIKDMLPNADITTSSLNIYNVFDDLAKDILLNLTYKSVNYYPQSLSFKGENTTEQDILENINWTKDFLPIYENIKGITEIGFLDRDLGLTDNSTSITEFKELPRFMGPYLGYLYTFRAYNINSLNIFCLWFLDTYYIQNGIIKCYYPINMDITKYFKKLQMLFKDYIYE